MFLKRMNERLRIPVSTSAPAFSQSTATGSIEYWLSPARFIPARILSWPLLTGPGQPRRTRVPVFSRALPGCCIARRTIPPRSLQRFTGRMTPTLFLSTRAMHPVIHLSHSQRRKKGFLKLRLRQLRSSSELPSSRSVHVD